MASVFPSRGGANLFPSMGGEGCGFERCEDRLWKGLRGGKRWGGPGRWGFARGSGGLHEGALGGSGWLCVRMAAGPGPLRA